MANIKGSKLTPIMTSANIKAGKYNSTFVIRPNHLVGGVSKIKKMRVKNI